VAAEDVEVLFVRRQPNRLREVLERGLGGVRFSETHLAAILPRLPETGAQPKRFIQQREPPARACCSRNPVRRRCPRTSANRSMATIRRARTKALTSLGLSRCRGRTPS
jgi:hypothetical protein